MRTASGTQRVSPTSPEGKTLTRPVDGAGSSRWAEAVQYASSRLLRAGVASPRYDAEELAAHVLGTDRGRLPLFLHEEVDSHLAEEFWRLVAQRASRIPLQSLLGSVSFRGLTVAVQPGVFIPRPETEVLVEVAVEHLRTQASRPEDGGPLPESRLSARGARCVAPRRGLNVLDIGTGSGCVALAVAHEIPASKVWATDVSAEALRCAASNARRLGLAERVVFLRADLTSACGRRAGSAFDAVLSNPPYVPTAQLHSLMPEVSCHDPVRALDGGPDGLSVVRRILKEAPRLLSPGGLLALELGDGQADELLADDKMVDWLSRTGMEVLDPVPDLAGVPRIFRALKKGAVS